MTGDKPAKKAFNWNPEEYGRRWQPRTTWKDTVMCDIQHMDITWENMLDNAIDRAEWRSWTALYALHRMD